MSDDPNSSGTRSGDSTSTVPTDDSPEPPKRGCRKRGCLLGCPGLIVLFWLIAASAWFSFFRFGPMEWLWRSLTFLRPQPMRERG